MNSGERLGMRIGKLEERIAKLERNVALNAGAIKLASNACADLLGRVKLAKEIANSATKSVVTLARLTGILPRAERRTGE